MRSVMRAPRPFRTRSIAPPSLASWCQYRPSGICAQGLGQGLGSRPADLVFAPTPPAGGIAAIGRLRHPLPARSPQPGQDLHLNRACSATRVTLRGSFRPRLASTTGGRSPGQPQTRREPAGSIRPARSWSVPAKPKQLHADVGDTVELQTIGGEPLRFRIEGVFHTGIETLDRSAYVSFEDLPGPANETGSISAFIALGRVCRSRAWPPFSRRGSGNMDRSAAGTG